MIGNDLSEQVIFGRGADGMRRHRIAGTALSCLLALSLGIAPVAFAVNANVAEGAELTTSASSAASSTASDSASSAGETGATDPKTYDFEGGYSATATADGEESVYSEEEIEATESDSNAGLAVNGGWLWIDNSTVSKSGDGAEADPEGLYGANAAVLAANAGSRAVVWNSQIASSAEKSSSLFATDSATLHASGLTVKNTAVNSQGAKATYGGNVVGDNLVISTAGDESAAVAADRDGNVSLTYSILNTEGKNSPLLHSAGSIEVNGLEGKAQNSQIARLEGANRLVISNSALESAYAGEAASEPVANGIAVYAPTSKDADGTSSKTALLQATNSDLTSSIRSGSLFYFTNTKAKVVLSSTTLNYDSNKAKLITAAGNNTGNWGNAGKNGAAITFTGIKQKLKGDVEVDTISSVDLYLLEGSAWTGASSILQNNDGATNGELLNVSIDGKSSWIVTENSTVTNLNIENGGKLVDNSGYAVKIVDKDGNTIVDGTSPTKITVTGKLSTYIKTSDANQIESTDIDRADFDAYFETDTAFGDEGIKVSNPTPSSSNSAAAANAGSEGSASLGSAGSANAGSEGSASLGSAGSASPTFASDDAQADDEVKASHSKDLVIGWFNNLS